MSYIRGTAQHITFDIEDDVVAANIPDWFFKLSHLDQLLSVWGGVGSYPG